MNNLAFGSYSFAVMQPITTLLYAALLAGSYLGVSAGSISEPAKNSIIAFWEDQSYEGLGVDVNRGNAAPPDTPLPHCVNLDTFLQVYPGISSFARREGDVLSRWYCIIYTAYDCSGASMQANVAWAPTLAAEFDNNVRSVKCDAGPYPPMKMAKRVEADGQDNDHRSSMVGLGDGDDGDSHGNGEDQDDPESHVCLENCEWTAEREAFLQEFNDAMPYRGAEA